MKKRLAVCVGLNYPNTAAALSGCVNDAQDWTKVLLGRGYEVRTLLEPTKMELVAELKAMLARARFGDRCVFTFSGHGTYVADKDGDEVDGRDEALCCADYNRGGLLTDDELFQIFGAVRYGVRRTILSDSCHSGTVARFKADPKPAAQGKPRYLDPVFVFEGKELEDARRAAELPAVGSKPRKGTVLISGCADPEFSYDASFSGRANGAFTYEAIRALTAPGVYDIKDWHTAIRKALPRPTFPQTPQLTASRHQRRWEAL